MSIAKLLWNPLRLPAKATGHHWQFHHCHPPCTLASQIWMLIRTCLQVVCTLGKYFDMVPTWSRPKPKASIGTRSVESKAIAIRVHIQYMHLPVQLGHCLTFLQIFKSCPVVAETQVLSESNLRRTVRHQRWRKSLTKSLGPSKSARPPHEQLPTPQVGNKVEPGLALQLPGSPH